MLWFDGLPLSAVISGRPRDNLCTPIVDLIAEGLHGKDREGLLQLRSNLLYAEEHRCNYECGRDQGDVIPG